MAFGVLTTFLTFGAGSAMAAFHGIATAKQCTSPTKIGDPYTCQVQALNVVDTGQDTLRVTGLSDVVHSAGGDVATGNILATTGLVFSGAVVCTGGAGAGTSADPYIGATSCLLPFGSSITTKPFSHYTVQAADFGLPSNRLTDTATVNWNNTCVSDPDQDCTTTPQSATAGSSALVSQLTTTTATEIHNAGGQTVTAVEVGTTVHDFVTVTGQPGNPPPTGNVTIDWFTNGTCTGNPAANSGNVALDGSGQADAVGFAFTPPPGNFAFKAHYLGDATYTGSDGPCEPLQVVDAYITINPPEATNPINTTHTYTAAVFVNDGSGFVAAPDGTQVTFTLLPGSVGSFTGANTCLTLGGSCTVDTTSANPGDDTMQASTTLAVAGVTMTRTTGQAAPGHANSDNAIKHWITTGTCPAAPAAFGLGAAGNYSVLGLAGAKLVISEGATKIQGDVGLGANGTGSLLKATINGKLFLDPTAHPDIHGDLTVTGGITVKSMAQEQADALAANLALAALAPTQTFGTLTGNTTITGGAGTNVISLGGVNMVKKTFTISGPANALFVFNVTGGFNFSSSKMILDGGVQPNNIIFNFIGPGADVDIFKDGTEAYGTFLAPYRNIIQDHATLTGRYIGATGGLTLKMHSAATLVCP